MTKVSTSSTPSESSSSKGITVRSKRAYHFLSFLMVFGPGLIVMEANNDAGAVSTYIQAGAQYGTHLLWVMFILLPIAYFIQEMVARLGIATGQGHASMIFKRFGKWWGLFSLFDLLLVNFLTLVTEFAAISLALSQMGISPMLSVPLAAVGLVFLVSTGSYRRWEIIMIGLCLLDLTWFWLASQSHTDFGNAFQNTLIPNIPEGGLTSDLIFLIIGMVGTTIAPWQLFFQQSCVADKKLRFADLKWARLDTLISACLTVLVAGAMIFVGNLALQNHIEFKDPAQLATALIPFAGDGVRNFILLMMCNAAILGATAVSLSSAWAFSEVRGWSNSLQMSFRSAPGFYMVYGFCVGLAASVVLIPNAPLQLIIVGVQVLAGVMLPSAVIFLQLLLNDRELLGNEFVNKPWNNFINWTIIALLFVLSLILAAQVIAPDIFPKSVG